MQSFEKPDAKNLFAQPAGETIVFQKLNTKREKPLPTANTLIIMDGNPLTTAIELDNIDPADIESIHVLKGENAVSNYGEKGKKGVILITTKKD